MGSAQAATARAVAMLLWRKTLRPLFCGGSLNWWHRSRAPEESHLGKIGEQLSAVGVALSSIRWNRLVEIYMGQAFRPSRRDDGGTKGMSAKEL
jgi:hypothetical protein